MNTNHATVFHRLLSTGDRHSEERQPRTLLPFHPESMMHGYSSSTRVFRQSSVLAEGYIPCMEFARRISEALAVLGATGTTRRHGLLNENRLASGVSARPSSSPVPGIH